MPSHPHGRLGIFNKYDRRTIQSTTTYGIYDERGLVVRILEIVVDIGLRSQVSSSCRAMKLFSDMVRLSMK